MTTETPPDAIAIVGIACRFPGAGNAREFWQNLVAGRESVTWFTDEELEAAGVPSSLRSDPSYVPAGGILEDVEGFDAAFFGMSPREAQLADPQQRVFMECAWEAFEDAGYVPGRLSGPVGVFAGSGTSDYLVKHVSRPAAGHEGLDDLAVIVGNDHDQLPARIAYRFDLRGPAVAVQTACSTSLVAVHLACESLLGRQCDLALAGGVTIKLPQRAGYRFMEGGVGSPDGHTRTFDTRAGGTVFASGAGVVLLKRADEAVRDRDHIYALLLGSSINNDGAAKVGYTAPSVDGQARVIREALALADVAPETIGYVEAHGTGTALGDPIEVAALARAYGARGGAGRCAIGSVKTNIGHTVAAAGVAGLIKAALALENGQIPASLNFEKANPEIPFASTPFFVNTTLQDWERGDNPRRAAVSSFGIGGTNAHVILQEPPPPPPAASAAARPHQLFVHSGRSSLAVETAQNTLDAYLAEQPASRHADAAYTLAVGRTPLPERRFAVRVPGASGPVVSGQGNASARREVAFLFPGGATQHIGMARGVYETEPRFRHRLDDLFGRLAPLVGSDLRQHVLCADAGDVAAGEALAHPALALPAICAVELALADLWMSWGVRPACMIGHSLGEYAAAYLAGVMSLDDTLALVALRGRLFGQMKPGAMLSVRASVEEVASRLAPDVSVAVVNAPGICVVSGPAESIAATAGMLGDEGFECTHLKLSMAAHSSLIDDIRPQFEAFVQDIELKPPSIPFASNLSGDWITAEQATDPAYWARHLRETVRFDLGLERLLSRGPLALLEVGPGQTLSAIAGHHPEVAKHVVVPSLPHPRDMTPDDAYLLGALGRLWAAGVEVDWEAHFAGAAARRVPLPGYPFERKRYWIDQAPEGPSESPRGKTGTPADWLYIPAWRQAPRLATEDNRNRVTQARGWLVFADSLGVSDELAREVRRRGARVVLVRPGQAFARSGNGEFSIRPDNESDMAALLQAVSADGPIDEVVHACSLRRASGRLSAKTFDDAQSFGLRSLLALIRALDADLSTRSLGLTAVTDRLVDPIGNAIEPSVGPLRGAVVVAQQEYPLLSARLLSIPPGRRAARFILDEIAADDAAVIAAYSAGHRWVEAFEQVVTQTNPRPAFHADGAYLITGGLGFLGSAIAGAIARDGGRQFAFVARNPMPARAHWDTWLDTHISADPTSVRIQRVRELEGLGATISIVDLDLADAPAVARVVDRVRETLGGIRGVVHVAGISDVSGLQPLRHTDDELLTRQFNPKVRGLIALDAALGRAALDFRIVVSSNSTVLGGLAHGAYVAANSFVDAFALRSHAAASGRWTSVSWDVLENVTTGTGASNAVAPYAMTSSEAEGVFRLVAGLDFPHVVISTGPLEARRGEWLDRRRLLARAGPAANESSDVTGRECSIPDLPADPVDAAVVRCWRSILGVGNAGLEDDFFALGGNSLVAVRLFRDLEDQFGIRLPLATLYEAPTPASLAALLRARGAMVPAATGAAESTASVPGPAATDWGYLVPVQTGADGRRPFFCVAGIAGNPLNLRGLASHLGADQPFYAFQSRGLNGIDEPHETIEAAAAAYLRTAREVQPTGPYRLGGYSSGGLVAFEMAQQLRASGEDVELLVFLDTFCLGWARKHGVRQRARWLLAGVRDEGVPFAVRWTRQKAPIYARRLAHPFRPMAPDKPVFTGNEARLIAAGLRAQERYETLPLDVPALLFRCEERTEHGYVPPDLGWTKFLPALRIARAPGSHGSMVEEPNVRLVAAELRHALDNPAQLPTTTPAAATSS